MIGEAATAATRQFGEVWRRQPDARRRVALTRLTTGACVLHVLRRMPPAALVHEQRELLQRAGQPKVWGELTPEQYVSARLVAAASVAAWTLGCEHLAVKVAANTSFAACQRHLVAMHEDLWSYTANLNVYLLALSAADSRWPRTTERGDADDVHSAVLAVLQTYYGMVYLQSGFSKLKVGGWRWMNGGTLRGSLSELGTKRGRALARRPRSWAAAASVATIGFEVGFLPALLLMWERRRLLGVASLGFHAVVRATMGISFWHHSIFSLPLFLLPTSQRLTPALRAPLPFAATVSRLLSVRVPGTRLA